MGKAYPYITLFTDEVYKGYLFNRIAAFCSYRKNSFFMHNGLGCVIHAKSIIGNNVLIYQNVTLGGRNGKSGISIGDNVIIGAGACVLGNIVIADNVKIGANAVVLSDISCGKTAIGIPARIV